MTYMNRQALICGHTAINSAVTAETAIPKALRKGAQALKASPDSRNRRDLYRVNHGCFLSFRPANISLRSIFAPPWTGEVSSGALSHFKLVLRLFEGALQCPARALLDVAAVSGWTQHTAHGARLLGVRQPEHRAVAAVTGGSEQVGGGFVGSHLGIIPVTHRVMCTPPAPSAPKTGLSLCFLRQILGGVGVAVVVGELVTRTPHFTLAQGFQ